MAVDTFQLAKKQGLDIFCVFCNAFSFRIKMVNANCDFCGNSYRKYPNVGYFKLTATLKSRLSVREGAGIETICGDHFAVTDISESGRLMPDARPIFFPRLSTAAHDHSYPKPKTRYDEEGIHIHNLLVPFPGHQLVCSPEHFKVTCKNTALAMSKCLEPDLV